MQSRLGGRRWLGIFAFGQSQVKVSYRFDRVQDLAGLHTHLLGKLGQDAPFLIPFGQLELAELIVVLHHRQRLDEQGCPGRRLVVNDRPDATLEFGPQRQHIPPIALGDQRLLQVWAGVRVGYHPLQLGHQPVVGDAQVAADVAKCIGSADPGFHRAPRWHA